MENAGQNKVSFNSVILFNHNYRRKINFNKGKSYAQMLQPLICICWDKYCIYLKDTQSLPPPHTNIQHWYAPIFSRREGQSSQCKYFLIVCICRNPTSCCSWTQRNPIKYSVSSKVQARIEDNGLCSIFARYVWFNLMVALNQKWVIQTLSYPELPVPLSSPDE